MIQDKLMFATAAVALCKSAHAGQKRKYTGEPYHVHPMRVLKIHSHFRQRHIPGCELAACLLHDVLEDTDTPLEFIEAFGPSTAALVGELTDKSKPSDGNRATRKAIDRAALAEASEAAQHIKCADLLENMGSIVEHDPDFARMYVKEKAALLEVMTKVHDTPIYDVASFFVKLYTTSPEAALGYWRQHENNIFGNTPNLHTKRTR